MDLKLPELSFQFVEDDKNFLNINIENQYFTEKLSDWLQALNVSGKLVLEEQPNLANVLLYMLNIQNMDRWGHFSGKAT